MRDIVIAADHAGFQLKQQLIEYLKDHQVTDLGCFSETAVDYPDYAKKLAAEISSSKMGILICGSGIGMSISANRLNNIRAALCMNEELAKLAREHNDANVLVLGARFTDLDTAKKCLDNFLNTPFNAGKHQQRVEKL